MSASPAIQTEPQDLVSLTKSAGESAKALAAEATRRVRTRILGTDGRIDAAKLEDQQHAAHGLAWLATYAEAVRELGGYAERLQAEGRFGETEALLVRIGAGEVVHHVDGAPEGTLRPALRLITDNMPALISYIDRERRFRFNNATYSAWLGKPLDEITGRRVD